jgi:hypothetical protein
MNRKLFVAVAAAAALTACGPVSPDEPAARSSRPATAARHQAGPYLMRTVARYADSDGLSGSETTALPTSFVSNDDDTLDEDGRLCPYSVRIDRETGLVTVIPTSCMALRADGRYRYSIDGGSGLWVRGKMSLTIEASLEIDSRPGWSRRYTLDVRAEKDESL